MKIFLMQGLLLLFIFIESAECKNSNNKIDRKGVITRHRIITTKNNPDSPAQVGNGEFAFGVDFTGLQTFTSHYTMSHWGWHSFPLPDSLKIGEFKGKAWNDYGRLVYLDDWNEEQADLSTWLAANPHSFNLGKIGLILKKSDGSIVSPEDIKHAVQETDLWTGVITSRFDLDNFPVIVKTLCHAEEDAIAVKIESELVRRGQIAVEFSFPYPGKTPYVLSVWDQPASHSTKIAHLGKQSIDLDRIMDDVHYHITVSWIGDVEFKNEEEHKFKLKPLVGKEISFVCAFKKDQDRKTNPTFSDCQNSSKKAWRKFWMSGAAIDLSQSKDARWRELERRIVLSQYLMRVNEAGSWPSQESGLVNNGWYGRFHFEMIWWHGVHYALWNRWNLLDKYLSVYRKFLLTSEMRAHRQGYNGARWPKCTADIDREWPHPIHATLIWQQPHPVYFAELDYRLHPTPETLLKWKDIVFQTVDFMADFAHYDKFNDRYVLGPPIYIVSENTDPRKTINPAFELGYWRYGLRIGQEWKKRLALPRDKKWDDVLNKLSSLPIEGGLYVTYEGIHDMWKKYTWEHPGLTGVYGMLPGDGVDKTVFKNTLEEVFNKWDFNRTWGWDFPMMAMAAARTGNQEEAIDLLLTEASGFQFDEHGLATGGPFPYFPSNGGLLTAVAMMIAGWDGTEKPLPGFPENGQWTVKYEGFNKMP